MVLFIRYSLYNYDLQPLTKFYVLCVSNKLLYYDQGTSIFYYDPFTNCAITIPVATAAFRLSAWPIFGMVNALET